MADIAQIGFAADTAALKDATSSLQAMVPAADKAEKLSQKLSSTLQAANDAAGKLLAAASGLSSTIERLDAVLARTVTTAGAAAGELNNTAAAASGEAVAANKAAVANDNNTRSLKAMGTAADSTASKLSVMQAVMNNSNFSFARNRGDDIAAYGEELDRLRAKFNPLFAVIQQYKKNIAEIREANRVGAIGIDEMNNALSRQRQAALLAIGAIKGSGGQVNSTLKEGKLRADEMLNVTRQFADVGTTLAMGMSPLMVLVQQGPQIADVFQTASMRGIGFAAVLRQIGAAAWGAIAPILPWLLAIAGGIAVVSAGFAMAAKEFDDGGKGIQDRLDLTDKQMEHLKKTGVDLTVSFGDTFKAFFVTVGDYLKEGFDGPIAWLKKAWSDTYDYVLALTINAIKMQVGRWVGAYEAIVATWRQWPKALGDLFFQGINAAIDAINWLLKKSIDGLNALIAAGNKILPSGLQIGQVGQAQISNVNNPFSGAATQTLKAGVDAYVKGFDAAGKAIDRFGDAWERNAKKIRDARVKAGAGDPGKTPKAGKSDAEKQAEQFEKIVGNAEAYIKSKQADTAALGLTAQAAAELKHQTDLLNEATKAGIPITDERRQKINDLATAMARADQEFTNAKGMKDLGDSVAQQMDALAQEEAMLGMTADQALRYKNEQDLLNQARQKGIELTPQTVADLQEMAGLLTDQQIRVRNLKEAMDFAKDAASGFFQDMKNGLMNGESIWKSFGNAVLSILNKIIDRMLEMASNQLFASLGGGGGGGFLNFLASALGGGGNIFGSKTYPGTPPISGSLRPVTYAAQGMAFDGIHQFAKGSGFTNSIVHSPTLFAFAKGGKLGVMGEKGSEAVMPLARGPDGSLGVMAHDTNGASQHISAEINVNQEFNLSGTITSDDAANMVKQASAQTIDQVKQSIIPWINQFNRDGAFS